MCRKLTHSFEKFHCVFKAAGRQTNGNNATFDREQARHTSHAQAIVHMASENRGLNGLVAGEITPSLIQGNGVFLKVPRPVDATKKTCRMPIKLDELSRAQCRITSRASEQPHRIYHAV